MVKMIIEWQLVLVSGVLYLARYPCGMPISIEMGWDSEVRVISHPGGSFIAGCIDFLQIHFDVTNFNEHFCAVDDGKLSLTCGMAPVLTACTALAKISLVWLYACE